MKRIFIFLLIAFILPAITSCDEISGSDGIQNILSGIIDTSKIETAQDINIDNNPLVEITSNVNGGNENVVTNITITVGNSEFSATLYGNETATALLEQLPMTLNMSELNGNEKYYYLPDKIPVDSERVESINIGDLMLYGSDCVVLFYKSFSTSYSYTRLGYVNDTSGLGAALGSGDAEVTFSINQ